MTINTKYNIGDTLYYLDIDEPKFPKIKTMIISKILSLTVNEIKYNNGKSENIEGTKIYYNGYETENWELIPEKLLEERVFSTKEELIKSL